MGRYAMGGMIPKGTPIQLNLCCMAGRMTPAMALAMTQTLQEANPQWKGVVNLSLRDLGMREQDLEFISRHSAFLRRMRGRS